MLYEFSLSTLKRRLKVMNIRRHDEEIGPDIVMEAVAVTVSKVSCLALQVDCVVQNFDSLAYENINFFNTRI